LIKDDFSALIELVKNAYDADASKVDIKFEELPKQQIKITIQDNGCGMSENTVRKNRFVPSTDNKISEKKSPNGTRILQGQKGI
jgi:C4-dicarboxylate-specific signal transduction histidine kinase